MMLSSQYDFAALVSSFVGDELPPNRVEPFDIEFRMGGPTAELSVRNAPQCY